jgi:hypothetical protein
MPSVVRWTAGIAGVVWIVCAFGFGFLALVEFGVVVLMGGGPAAWVVVVASVIAAPVSLLLGLLLFAPTRKVLVLSTLWAALGAAIVAILVAWPDAGGGGIAGVIIVFIVPGLLSLLAWRRLAKER